MHRASQQAGFTGGTAEVLGHVLHVVLQVGHLFTSITSDVHPFALWGVTTRCQDLLPAWATVLESEDRRAANRDASLSPGKGTFPIRT